MSTIREVIDACVSNSFLGGPFVAGSQGTYNLDGRHKVSHRWALMSQDDCLYVHVVLRGHVQTQVGYHFVIKHHQALCNPCNSSSLTNQ